VKNALDAWFHEVRRAEWKNSADLKRSFGTASIISSDRAVLSRATTFRPVVAIEYRRQIGFYQVGRKSCGMRFD